MVKLWTSDFDNKIDSILTMLDLVNTVDVSDQTQWNTLASITQKLEALIGSDAVEAGSLRDALLYYVGNVGDIPITPAFAESDEFDDIATITGPGAKWSWIRGGAPSAVSGDYSEDWGVDEGSLWLRMINDTNVFWTDAHCLSQPCPLIAVPGDTPWTIACKMRFAVQGNYSNWGLFSDDGTDNNILLTRYVFNTSYEATTYLTRAGGGAWSGDVGLHRHNEDFAYLALRWDGTYLWPYTSLDGIDWVLKGRHTTGWNPQRFGIYGMSASVTVAERLVIFPWFRRLA